MHYDLQTREDVQWLTWARVTKEKNKTGFDQQDRMSCCTKGMHTHHTIKPKLPKRQEGQAEIQGGTGKYTGPVLCYQSLHYKPKTQK